MDEIDFKLLRCLSETGNISHAAEKLYITQSALSKRVKAIEKELGVEILLRSRQGIRFTPAGEAILQHSRQAALELETMRQRIDLMQNEVCGTLNAGISINYSLYRLPDVLTAYHQKHPMVNLQITTGQSRALYKQMVEGTLDLAIIRGEYPWDGMQFMLSQENICFICSRADENKPLSEYLYINRRTDLSLEAMTVRWLHENGLSSQPSGFCVDSITTCVAIVQRGLGWSILPEIGLEHFDGCIKPCTFQNGEPFIRRTYVFCQKEALKLPQVEAFVEQLKQAR